MKIIEREREIQKLHIISFVEIHHIIYIFDSRLRSIFLI